MRPGLKAFAVAALLGCATAAGAQSPAPATTALTLPQARAMATEALRRGDDAFAARLAEGLLQATPEDPLPWLILARARAAQGDHAAAGRAAARAWRHADTPGLHLAAAEQAARSAHRTGRTTTAQLWLRRAARYAPDARTEDLIARDYARLRAENPLQFSFRFGIRPSDNVNNGANSTVQVIDGIPVTGSLSGSAQALSGVLASGDVQLSYRLRGDARSRTALGARVYHQRVFLGDAARARAPTLRPGDLDQTYVEASLTHAFALGETGTARMTGAVGTYRYGGRRVYDFARLGGAREWRLRPNTALQLGATIERRASARGTLQDSTALGLTGVLVHRLASADTLSLSLDLRDTDSDTENLRVQSTSLGMRYTRAAPVGPAQVSAGLTLGYADYADYALVFRVPGGRQDRSVYADVNLFFPDYDYAGFAPDVTFRAGRSFSNVSRFETEELSVSFGLRSKF